MKNENTKRRSLIEISLNRKWYLLLLTMTFCLFSTDLFAQNDLITLDLSKVKLEQVLNAIEKQCDYLFTYGNNIDVDQRVSISANAKPLKEILHELFSAIGIQYVVSNTSIVLSPISKAKNDADGQPMTGKVSEHDGSPLIGATIINKRTSKATTSDVNGRFSMKVNAGDVLTVSYIGMKTTEMIISSKQTSLDIVLQENINVLNDIVVTGYQTLSRERATGSYDIISEKKIKNRLGKSILSRIEGLVPGINLYGNKDANDDNVLTIRGVSTYSANQKPLYVVDGMPYEGDISLIHPDDIANITVLKDASANSIYGAQAANGVIVFSTKNGTYGKAKVRYSGSVGFSPKPDFDYLKLIGSSDLIDLQIEGFNFYHGARKNNRVGLNPVIDLLYQHEEGTITDDQLTKSLLPYRNLDNRDQILNEFGRTSVTFQHNVSVSGGNDKHNYFISLNYLDDNSNLKDAGNKQIGVSLKEQVNFTRWLRGDFAIHGNFTKATAYTGATNLYSLITKYPSYYMIRDEQNNVLDLPNDKSQSELDRLITIGLKDETYSPITNRKEEEYNNDAHFFRLQTGFYFKIAEGLTGDVKFQMEKGSGEERTYYTAKSHKVRSMINNAAYYDESTQAITLNVPDGGQLNRCLTDHYAYTLRGQMNYSKTINRKHSITALIGTERRLIKDKSNYDYYMGYNDNSREIGYYNPLALVNMVNTQSISGKFNWEQKNYIKMDEIENRYVSFYANASYVYNDKYSVTGSLRIDQSNLFGTNVNDQYKPFWSVGAGWRISEETFMSKIDFLDHLNIRFTYGISGNVAKDAGPYLTARNQGLDQYTGEMALFPLFPANKDLKWERTAMTNVGFDFSFLQSRLRGSVDFYNKSTSDLLGYRDVNPTSGWTRIMVNYGNMYNRGIEIGLSQSFLRTETFSWETSVNFSYNKNNLTNLTGTPEGVSSYTMGTSDVKGYPLKSLFSYRYAGLNPTNGKVLVYDKNGNKQNNVTDITDLVYSGTRIPKYNASMINKFGWKNLEFSFLLVYYGGHSLRRVTANIMNSYPSANVHNSILNRWKKSGDELKNGVMPGIQQLSVTTDVLTWSAADYNVRKADYIKLREIGLSYKLSGAWFNRHKIQDATITFQINNLYWWAANGDIDPEAYVLGNTSHTPYLTLREPVTYTFGLNLTF